MQYQPDQCSHFEPSTLDLHGAGLARFRLGQRDGQDPVVELGLDLFLVDGFLHSTPDQNKKAPPGRTWFVREGLP